MTPADALNLAHEWAARGVPAFPIAIWWDETKKATNKRPLTPHGHRSASAKPDEVSRQFAGVALRPGEELGVALWPGPANRLVLDVDTKGGKRGEDELDALEAEHGRLPDHPIVITASGGTHRWFAKPAGVHVANVDLAPDVEVRADDGWVVAPGVTTTWGSWTVDEVTLGPAPMWPDWLAERLGQPSSPGGNGKAKAGKWSKLDRDALDPRDLAALEALEACGGHGAYIGGDDTIQVVRPGKTAGASASIGYVGPGIAKVFTNSWPPFRKDALYDADELHTLADGKSDDEREAKQGGDEKAAGDTKRKTKTKTRGALADGFRGTDVGNADRLVAAADGHIRFVHAWSKWITWREGRWIIDTGDTLVTEAAKQVPRAMIQLAATLDGDKRDNLWKWAVRSETASAVTAMVRLARGVAGVLVDHHQLDADPWLLNVRNGTIDLRTGQLRPHKPDDLITMQAPVIYDPDAEAPLWGKCVEQWQPDKKIRDFLQRVVGSGIAGTPVERFFVNYGEGANGKSKFFGAIASVLGPYYVVPHKSLLVVQRHEQHDTIKAKLFRTRMAVGAETDQGARLDEAKIKDLTGGDPLEARRMREDPWQFNPTWTLFLHTNYRPAVRDMTEGTWRRLRLIPWPVTIPENERDPDLAAKLAAERSGILNWLIAGCLAWQRGGFAEPDGVTAATQEWRGDEDAVGRFIQERCWVHPLAQVAAKAIRGAFEAWCDESGEESLSATALGAELRRRGFTPDQEKGGKRARLWKGVGLAADGTEGEGEVDVA